MVMEVIGTDISSTPVKIVIDDESNLEKNRGLNGTSSLDKSDVPDGSSAGNGEIKEIEHANDSAAPKDAVDEWPAEKQTHSFYFIRYRSYEDPKLKAKMEQADKEVQRKTQARVQITEALREKRSEKADLISQLKPLQEEERQFRSVMDGKRKEMEPLQAALGKLRGSRNAAVDRGVAICSSEEELNETIQSLQYCIQHESNTLAVEKQLIKEIKQLEASREKVIANSALKAKIQESFGQKDAIQDQVKLIGVDLDGARKEQQAIRAKIQHLEEKLNAVRAELDSLQTDLVAINEGRDKAYHTLTLLRKERDESNASFYQYRSLMNNVKGLSFNKDIRALEELSNNELEKFMSQWSSNKAMRDDYEKRALASLDMRQLSRDGRMRNPDEKPILSAAPIVIEAVKEPSKSIKKEKENVIPPRHEAAPIPLKVAEVAEKPTEIESQNIPEAEMPQKEPLKVKEIDPAKLKEMKREEEITKAKLATERKKKLAEKAAAKAAIRAQKEAEKKLKEKEKKARKKAGSSLLPADSEQVETDTNEAEPVLHDEPNATTEAPIPEKSKDLFKERSIRSHGRGRGQGQIPKALMRRKKAHYSYWLWAAPAAVSAVLLAIFGYYYYYSPGISQ